MYIYIYTHALRIWKTTYTYTHIYRERYEPTVFTGSNGVLGGSSKVMYEMWHRPEAITVQSRETTRCCSIEVLVELNLLLRDQHFDLVFSFVCDLFQISWPCQWSVGGFRETWRSCEVNQRACSATIRTISLKWFWHFVGRSNIDTQTRWYHCGSFLDHSHCRANQ